MISNTSPIKNLSPETKIRRSTIFQEEFFQIKARRVQLQNQKLNDQILILRKKLAQTEANGPLLQQNLRLKEELNFANLKLKQNFINQQTANYHSAEVIRTNLEDNTYFNHEINLLREKYQNEIFYLQQQNEDIRSKLIQAKTFQQYELEDLKNKYTNLHLHDSQTLKMTHIQEINLLLQEIERLKQLLDQKSVELQIQHQQRNNLKIQMEAELGQKISEINILKSQIQILEDEKYRTQKQVQTKRLLQRSRGSVIIQNSTQCSNYLERQIKKLTDEISEKNLQIEILNKFHLSQKKKFQEKEKQYEQQIQNVQRQTESRIKDMNELKIRRQSNLQSQLLNQKSTYQQLEIKLQNIQKEFFNLKSQYEILNNSLTDQKLENQGLKLIVEQQRDDHLRQITKILNQKSGRRSSRIISNISYNVPEAQIDSVIVENQPMETDIGYNNKQNTKKSSITQQIVDTKRVESIYELKINQITKSHNLKINKLNSQIEKLQKLLKEKSKELQQCLIKFVPLLQLKAGDSSLSEDRIQRIQKHLKADLSILQILLKKNKIKVWQ